MADDDLQTFRERWQQELGQNKTRREHDGGAGDEAGKCSHGSPASPGRTTSGSVVREDRDTVIPHHEEQGTGNREAQGTSQAWRDIDNQDAGKGFHDSVSSPVCAGKQSPGTSNSDTWVPQTCKNTEANTPSSPPETHCSQGPLPGRPPEYVSIAQGLLDGRTSPLLGRMQVERTRRKRQLDSAAKTQPRSDQQAPLHKVNRKGTLLDQLIQDLNEINDIPFFDVELPYELALQIFQYLSRTDLGHCAQVSRTWKVLAEDEVLWYRLCLREGYLTGASVSDSPCWKGTLRDCRKMEDTLRYNWKNRVGAISHLQYELGKVLCDVSSCDGLVIAGYTSGDVRLWDTLNWDAAATYLQPSHVSMGTALRPHISHVRLNETVAVAAYEDGMVDVWSTEAGQQPIHHYQHLQRVQALALGAEGAAVVTASGTQVRVDGPVDKGYWSKLCQVELQKPVEFLQLVPETEGVLTVASACETVHLLRPEQAPSVLHCVYGHPVTCLDVSCSQAALGVKSRGWAMNDGNKIQVYSLHTGQAVLSMGNSAGDFTCVNLRDSPSNLLVSGNKDRRVRVFDLRTGSQVTSLYAHHLGVSAVQADDWKIVSGGEEGLVCVWEMRMGAKLWEMHNRHPVRHIRFRTSTLITANVPDEKSPRGACITDDDLTAHRRHRGVIYLYDFSVDTSASENVLPICRSDYVESTGYNYNIGLAVPYDVLAGAKPAL